MVSEHEKKIIEIFLRGYNRRFGTTYNVKEWPEEVEKARHSATQSKAIDALAIDSGGKRLAIELTRVEAFESATEKDSKFEPIISALKNPSIAIPDHHMIVYMHLDSMDRIRRADRNKLGQEFAAWFDTLKRALPDGMSHYRPTFSGRRLNVGIVKCRSGAGQVTFQRYPQLRFLPRLRRALLCKVPKLRDYKPTDYRILLLERRDNDTPNFWDFGKELKRLERSCDLFSLNMVWLADTSQLLLGNCAGNRAYIDFYCVWPTVGEDSFREQIANSEINAVVASR